jgi:hypothetical protein
VQQQELHLAARVRAVAVQPGRNDPALVEHHHVAGTDEFGQVVEVAVLGSAGGPVQQQQP